MRHVVRDAVTLGELPLRLARLVVEEDEVLVEPRSELRAAARVEGAHRGRQHHPLVDLGLELELELRRRAARASALDDVDEVAHALDDLAERVEVELAARSGSGGSATLTSRSPSAPSRRSKASRSPAPAPARSPRRSRPAIEPVERARGRSCTRDPAQRVASRTERHCRVRRRRSRTLDAVHCRTPRVPRVGHDAAGRQRASPAARCRSSASARTP